MYGLFLPMHLILYYYRFGEAIELSFGIVLVIKAVQFLSIGLYYEYLGAKKLTFYKNVGVSPKSIFCVTFLIDFIPTLPTLNLF
ncbi:hypothetical protein BFP71_06385 [Roseivirga misakiensis]|uniref:Uncharacterized protein n=2 Tax=Roseivirga misakiensis TaxID=1563681 RepID=A0A1E5T314_9BACT|nr:hypothetical protein BFP71_06385 [Roseivirga misakiensis]